jgi:hypothetical protein
VIRLAGNAVFDNAMVSMATGLVNIRANSTTSFCILGSASPTSYKGTWGTYNNVKYSGGLFEIAQVGTTDYPLGGNGIATAVPTVTSAVTGLKTTAPTVFTTTSTIAASYAAVQTLINSGSPTSVTTTNPLLSYHNIGSQSVTNGTLTLTWNTNGIFTMTVGADS